MAEKSPIVDLRVETPRLVLRQLCGADCEEFIRVFDESREHFAATTPTPRIGQTATEIWRRSILNAQDGAAGGNGAALVGLLKDQGQEGEPTRIAGFFNLNNIVRGAFQNAAAGWRVSVDCVGRGLGSEGVYAMLDLAFAPPPRGLGLHRVDANIRPDNVESLRVAEKCGFRREGVALRMLDIAGAWRDHVMVAKLTDEHESRYLK